MPEAVAVFGASRDLSRTQAIHRSILETCREDFAKYSNPSQLEKVRRVFALAEQFIGQHLRHLHLGRKPELFYFLREGKSGNAEVDYLLQVENRVIPIEVKAGAAGTMRSMHQFLALRGGDLAVRFDMNPPSLQEVTTTITTPIGPKSIQFRLLSLPLFLVERVHEIAKSMM